MMRKQWLLVVIFVLAGGVGLWKTVRYFFPASLPIIEVTGVTPNGICAGDVACVLSGSHTSQINSVSLWLDGQPLVDSFPVTKRRFSYPFVLSTGALSDGPHQLTVRTISGGYRRRESVTNIPFTVDNSPLHLAWITRETPMKAFQGKTLHVQFQSDKPLKDAEVTFLGNRYPVVRERENALIYEAFIPIQVDDRPSEYPLIIKVVDQLGTHGELEAKAQVIAFPFALITPKRPDQMTEHIHSGSALITDARGFVQTAEKQKLWRGVFESPCPIQESTLPFGAQYVGVQGTIRSEVVELICRAPGVICAAQDGVLVGKKEYASLGHAVFIDHGAGVLGVFAGLDQACSLEVGSRVTKGTRLGSARLSGGKPCGMWGLVVHGVPVDPVQWMQLSF